MRVPPLCRCLLAAALLVTYLPGLSAHARGLTTVRDNITVYFINVLDSGAKFFSRKLRGHMMAGELQKQRPGWSVHWMSSRDLALSIERTSDAVERDSSTVCVFVKGYLKRLADMCHSKLHAIVLFDTVDNLAYLKHADDAAFLRAHHIDAMIVQTALKASQARAKGLDAYYLPHHHTNFADIHRDWSSMTGPAKTIALLSGSRLNNPPQAELESIANTTCSLGVELVFIEQGPRLPLQTTVTRFSCLHEGGIRPETNSSVDQGGNSELDDPYQQIQHHRQPIFSEVDVALLWPPTYHDGPTTELRPPTRLLFWMVHGIPALFYPYVAYAEVTKTYRYYEKCGIDPYIVYNVTNTHSNLKASLELLVGEDRALTRQCLSRNGRAIASHYSPAGLGAMYAEAIESMFQQ